MVCVRRLRDKNPNFEGQRASDVPTILSTLAGTLVKDSRPPSKSSSRGSLVKIAPLTSEAVARMRAVGAKTANVTKVLAERTVQEKSSSTKGVRVATDEVSRNLEHHASEVTQAQLDGLRVLLYIPATISIRAPSFGELFHNTLDDKNEIPFSMVAFECGVKLPLAPLLRQFLSKMPFHPL